MTARHRRHAGRDRPPVQHPPPDGVHQAPAPADPWRARQWPAGGRWCRPGIGGTLVVITRNAASNCAPSATAAPPSSASTPVKLPVGTRIEISFGPAIPEDERRARIGRRSRCRLAQAEQTYTGKTSPWWYDVPQFHELLSASGDTPVRELVSQLDGCTGARLARLLPHAGLDRALCKDVTRQQAAQVAAGRPRQRPSR